MRGKFNLLRSLLSWLIIATFASVIYIPYGGLLDADLLLILFLSAIIAFNIIIWMTLPAFAKLKRAAGVSIAIICVLLLSPQTIFAIVLKLSTAAVLTTLLTSILYFSQSRKKT